MDQSWENSTEGDNMTMTMNETGQSQKKTFLEFDKCTPLDDVTPWCYTRVDENGTYILGTKIEILDLQSIGTGPYISSLLNSWLQNP